MKNVFKKSDTVRPKRAQHHVFGTKRLASRGPKICNLHPVNIKSAETFEKLIKTWDGEMCKCRMCTYNKNH